MDLVTGIVICFVVACAAGVVSTWINRNKPQVIQAPRAKKAEHGDVDVASLFRRDADPKKGPDA